jgi:circadian clock protein KaiC
MDGSATARTIEAVKVRGQQPMPGQHGVRLTGDGVEVFPRWPTPTVRQPWSYPRTPLAVGMDEVDRILGGGVPMGDALLVEGPSGTGKSILATHFIAHGGHSGEPGVVFLFEERPDRFVERAEAFNLGLARLVRAGMVEVLSFRGRDMSSDEVIAEMHREIRRVGARRVVIDSAGSLELVLTRSSSLQDCLWRLLDGLTGAGVTVWLNSTPDAARPSLAPLVDDVLVLQRVEHETSLENRLVVTKMRWNPHDATLVAYQIRPEGMRVSEPRTKPAPLGCLFDVPVVGAHTNAGVALAAAG